VAVGSEEEIYSKLDFSLKEAGMYKEGILFG
jgi:hypothetical protein